MRPTISSRFNQETQPKTFIITDAQRNKYNPEDKIFDEPDHAKGDNVSLAASSLEYVTAGVGPDSGTNNFDNEFDRTLSNFDDDPKQSQQDDDNAKNTEVDDGNDNKETIKTTGVNDTHKPNKKTGVEEPITERKRYFLCARKQRSYNHLHRKPYINQQTSKHKLPPKQQHQQREQQVRGNSVNLTSTTMTSSSTMRRIHPVMTTEKE